MTDYLHNLVARHLNQIEVVQPRLASRFEPQRMMSPLGNADASGLEEPEAPAEVESTAAESSFVSSLTDMSPLSTRAAVAPPPPAYQVSLEPSTGDKFSSVPPETNAPGGSDTHTKRRDDFEQETHTHPSVVEEVPAQPVDEPAPLAGATRQVTGAPAASQLAVSPTTLEEETFAPPAQFRRAEVYGPEKQIISTPEPSPVLQPTPERPDNSVPSNIASAPKLTPAHMRREVATASESREAPRQSADPMPDPTIPRSLLTPWQQEGHPARPSKTIATEAPASQRAPSPQSLDSPSQKISPAGRERASERTVERVVIERLMPAESRGIMKPPEGDRERARVKRPPESAGVLAQPQVIRYAEPKAAAHSEAVQGAEPVPTINVTIGRIEVRAVAPDAPARERRQSASQPRMSLSDYLHRRAGGGFR
jgi:hypothetical protein